MRLTRPFERGVSLVEALVALIVLAFGTLALLGVQSELRLSADVSRQRAEAVRMAQETLEQRRSFAKLDTGLNGRFVDIVDAAPSAVLNPKFNTTFMLREDVAISTDPRIRAVKVSVSWQDRTGTAQQIHLAGSIFGVEPELAGSLTIPSDRSLIRNPHARHPAVPVDSVDLGNGSSEFEPPAAAGIRWVFDNATGQITSTCQAGLCTALHAWLVSGFIRYALVGPPGASDAETPASPALPVGVVVEQTAPDVRVISCHERMTASYTAYFCAVPVSVRSGTWSGRSLVNGLSLAANVADPDASRHRICRYTPFRDHRIAPTAMKNAEHPLNYAGVDRALTSQNFLVVPAGDGLSAYGCPDDDPTTTHVLGTTWHHQPAQ